MAPLTSIVLQLALVSLLSSSTSAILCHNCQWVYPYVDNYGCAVGGSALEREPGRSGSDSSIEKVMGVVGSQRQGSSGEAVEACLTFYGPQDNGSYTVIRTYFNTNKSYVGECFTDPPTLAKFCFCATDYCNSDVPAGILKCHLCYHAANSQPRPGCVSAQETVQVHARKAGELTEVDRLTSSITAIGSRQRKRSRRDVAYFKYQKCLTFEGTYNNEPVYLRAKGYLTEDNEGCYPVQESQAAGTFCYCSTDLCNNLPGKTAGTGGNSGNVNLLNIHVFLIGLVALIWTKY